MAEISDVVTARPDSKADSRRLKEIDGEIDLWIGQPKNMQPGYGVDTLAFLRRLIADRDAEIAAIRTAEFASGALVGGADATGDPPAGDEGSHAGEPATDDADYYTLSDAQKVIRHSYRVTLAQLGLQVSVSLKATDLDDDRAMNVPVSEMLRAAAILAAAIARRVLKREPDPALWRKATDQIFADVVGLVGADPEPDPIGLLREARDYVYAALTDEDSEAQRNSAALLAEIDSILEAA